MLCGGAFGAGAREALEQAVHTPAGDFPVATFVVNLAGAFLLGVLLEALVRSGRDAGWRRRARLLGGTGFCGAFTTYSTMAVETVQLARHGQGPTAAIYMALSVAGGLVAASGGIAIAATRSHLRTARLPVDPDVERTEPLG